MISFADKSTRSFEAQFRVTTPDGRLQWADLCGIAVRDEQAKLVRIVAQQRTIAGAVEGKSSASPSPFHDPLTGLPNRSLFHRCLSECPGWCTGAKRRRDSQFCLSISMVQDNQRSSRSSDGRSKRSWLSHGGFHIVVRPEDVLARRDGDEFTILIKDIERTGRSGDDCRTHLQHLRSPLALNGTDFVDHREHRHRVERG